MFKKLTAWWQAETPTLSPYQEALLRYKRMSVVDVTVYSDIRRIETLVPTIDRYLTLAGKAVQCLEESQHFPSFTDDIYLRLVRKKAFYLSHDGCYLSVSQEHLAFVEVVCYLLDLYERKSLELNQSALLQSNLTRILPVINNLITLSTTLTEDPSD